MGEPGQRGLVYGSALALNAAIGARIKAAANNGADPMALRRQFAYDRFLSRLFAPGSANWVLKGGTALLSRVRSARNTLDIDLLHDTATGLDEAEDALRAAAERDIGDYFRFEIGASEPIATGADTPVDGRRLHVTARCGGAAAFAQFRIDLVITDHMTAAPELIMPTPVLDIAGLPQPPYRVYPVADHIADKVTATAQRYGGRPSSRVRDLVDLALIAETQHVDASQLGAALTSKRLLHQLPVIDTFTTPPDWAARFRTAAAPAELGAHADYNAALALTRSLLDPILSGRRSSGVWSPETLAWED